MDNTLTGVLEAVEVVLEQTVIRLFHLMAALVKQTQSLAAP
jgi:hypothetical protein